ncbi:Uncharacterized protein FWK35_00016311 [Aphis craccivora]|uniref:Uncharacterized protein n=1 Tax=Aphis craccivora TaxID=307492 RepID=A0A6G0XZN1_APHCR|nr:Uncharacterized protein FWK35_00016311 [Aphis craccivora]
MSDSFFSPPPPKKKKIASKTVEAERCMSPDLFPDTYNLADYTLRTSPAASSLNILELLSTEFPRDNEILNDAQSFHWSHTGWPSSDDDDQVCYKILHWSIGRRSCYQDSA